MVGVKYRKKGFSYFLSRKPNAFSIIRSCVYFSAELYRSIVLKQLRLDNNYERFLVPNIQK